MDISQPEDAGGPKKDRLARLLAEYGPAFLLAYFGIFVISLVSFAWAIERGFGSEIDRWAVKIGGWIPWLSDEAGATGAVGTWAAAWVAAKLTQPLRIAAAVAVAALIHRIRLKRRQG